PSTAPPRPLAAAFCKKYLQFVRQNPMRLDIHHVRTQPSGLLGMLTMPAMELSLNAMTPPAASRLDSDDATLLQQYIANGDREAIDMLFRRHADSAYRTALRCCGNSADAEDAVQAAFLEVLQ